jgi:hypothetical protein
MPHNHRLAHPASFNASCVFFCGTTEVFFQVHGDRAFDRATMLGRNALGAFASAFKPLGDALANASTLVTGAGGSEDAPAPVAPP